MFEFLRELNAITLIKTIIQLLVASLQFTSLIVMVYILTKCISKSKKGSIIIGVILWWIVQTIVNSIVFEILGINHGVMEVYMQTGTFFLYNLIIMMFVAIYYFITVKLIENKLEVY